MKCHILLSRKNKKTITVCSLLNFLPSMQCKLMRSFSCCSYVNVNSIDTEFPVFVYSPVRIFLVCWYVNTTIFTANSEYNALDKMIMLYS